MKYFLLSAFTMCFLTLQAQEIQLQNLEEALKNLVNGDYQVVLEKQGFHLMESADEDNGIYEKWIKEKNGLLVCIQHSDTFHFTKLTISSLEEASRKTIDHLLNQVTKSYGRMVAESLEYYVKEELPNTTVHLLDLAENASRVNGIMFFRKF